MNERVVRVIFRVVNKSCVKIVMRVNLSRSGESYFQARDAERTGSSSIGDGGGDGEAARENTICARRERKRTRGYQVHIAWIFELIGSVLRSRVR